MAKLPTELSGRQVRTALERAGTLRTILHEAGLTAEDLLALL